MAAQVDFYGTSFYPKHSAFVARDAQWRGALLDFTRSFGYDEGRHGFYVGELQGSVELLGTPSDPRVDGEITVIRGTFKPQFTRARFTQTTGTVSFQRFSRFPGHEERAGHQEWAFSSRQVKR